MNDDAAYRTRPGGVTALAILFGAGALISGTSCLSLLSPGGRLEPMWRLNPRAREAFSQMGVAGPLLLAFVSSSCAPAALGLWRGRLWGYWAAVTLLGANMVGDILNALLGVEPRALVGVPIVAGLLAFLASASVRGFFQVGVPGRTDRP